MISTVCWMGFSVFSAAALCVVFVKSHKKAPDCAINNNDAAFHTDLNPDLETVAKVMGF